MRVAVVGSGLAGVAAARALLDGGLAVDMLDFGNEIESSAKDLASRLRSGSPSAEDLARLRPPRATRGIVRTAANWFTSLRGRAPILSLTEKTRLGSLFTFQDVEWGIPVEGATVARSLAKGGLSNIWGAACFPLTDQDYADWPVQEKDMAPHYGAVARMLSLIEREDDLAVVYPIYGPKSEGLPLNPQAADLFKHWQQNHDRLASQGIVFGRTRLAVRAKETADGPGCQLCGLCLYGCPYDAIYRADWTLSALRQNQSFLYLKPLWVQSFREEGDRVVVDAVDRGEGQLKRLDYDALFLAAGTLSSLRIVADAQAQYGRSVRLFDSDVYIVPFLRTAEGGGLSAPLHFSLNELVLRVYIWGHPIHIQFYCMNEQIIDQFRPLLSALPKSLRRRVDALLGRFFLAFVCLPGNVSAHIEATVRPGTPVATVSVVQRRRAESSKIVRRLIRYLARSWSPLGLYPVGPILRSTPTGPSGGRVVGALPMVDRPGPLQTDPDGRLYGTNRVYVVDGAAMPSSAAQNTAYTIMANAHRIGTTFAKRQGVRSEIMSVPSKGVFSPHQLSTSSPRTDTEVHFGRTHVKPLVLALDHHRHQCDGSVLIAAYNRLVLGQAVRMACLRSGMHVLDYGCGHQQLRKALPPGVRYTGYDAVAKLSEVEDPRGGPYDLVFALQVLMYLDARGLGEWVETFAAATKDLVVMVPARNFLKDNVLDRVFGLKDLREQREQMVQSLPPEIYEQLSRHFSLLSSRNLLCMGELTRWQR